jgi:hypothetical protein
VRTPASVAELQVHGYARRREGSRGNLAGGTFERCRAGLPERFEDNIDTYCLDALPDGSFAAFGTSDGRVYGSTDQGASWDERASGLQPVQRVLVLP